LFKSFETYFVTFFAAFTVSYGDQSKMQGYLVSDVITIGNSSVVASFGGIVNSLANGGLPGLFEPPNVEGIIGFGHTSLNCAPTCAPTVLDKFASAGILNPYMFAMCFTPTYGNLDIGQIDPIKFNGTLNYISFLTSGAGSGYYTTAMASSMFGTAALLSGSVNVIWDSGSTLIIGSSTWLNNIQAAAVAAGAYNSAAFFSGVVANMNATQLATWPLLKFTFMNTSGLPFEVNIPASIYFIKLGGDPNAPYYRIGISAGASSLFILGDTFLQVLYTVFDNTNGRLAVAPVGDCSHMINSCTVNCTQGTLFLLLIYSQPISTAHLLSWFVQLYQFRRLHPPLLPLHALPPSFSPLAHLLRFTMSPLPCWFCCCHQCFLDVKDVSIGSSEYFTFLFAALMSCRLCRVGIL
jgi:hypothetical protein